MSRNVDSRRRQERQLKVTKVGAMLIVEFISTIVILIAKIVFIKDTSIIFRDIVVILIMKFILAKVLFLIIILFRSFIII